MMKSSFVKISALLLMVVLLCGCPSAPPKAEKENLGRPEITLQIATLNLAQFNKRIERKNIVDLAKTLKREQIELLAVQGISRYPGVTTRVDFVNELTAQTDWRSLFGEMQNISGRQTGNAIFSSYPILTHHNQTFDKIKSAEFEAGLQATVDGGVRSLVIVSAQIPPKASSTDQDRCIKLLAALNPDKTNPLTILAGTLPSSQNIRTENSFDEILPIESSKNSDSKLWYSANRAFHLVSSRTIETDLGTLVVAQLGVYR